MVQVSKGCLTSYHLWVAVLGAGLEAALIAYAKHAGWRYPWLDWHGPTAVNVWTLNGTLLAFTLGFLQSRAIRQYDEANQGVKNLCDAAGKLVFKIRLAKIKRHEKEQSHVIFHEQAHYVGMMMMKNAVLRTYAAVCW